MKIAEVVATFPPHHGGMGYVCLYNSLELARRGHDVTVFTLEHGRLTYENDPPELNIVRLNSPLIYGDGGVVPQLVTLLSGFDIVHLHYPFFGGAEYVYLNSLITGTRYFMTYYMDVYGNTALKKIIIGMYEPLLLKRIVRRASAICSPGKNFLQTTKAARMIDYEKLSDVGFGGVDSTRFMPREKNRTLLEKYRLDGKIVLLFVGNLIPFKGLHLLINALAKIDMPQVSLLVIGGGYAEMEYRKQVETMGLESRVVFAGPKSPAVDFADHYNLGDIFVLPSTHSESYGLVILEAMASGLPVVVSALPGPAQLVEDGVDGLLTAVGDSEDLGRKITFLLENREIRLLMGAAARKKIIGRFNWETIGGQLEKALVDIVHG